MSFLIGLLSFQVMRGRPILCDPSGIQLSACFARLPSSIRCMWPHHRSLCSLIFISSWSCLVSSRTLSFLTLSCQEMFRIRRRHLWWAASSRLQLACDIGHRENYKRVCAPLFLSDPILSFNMPVYRGVVSAMSWLGKPKILNDVKSRNVVTSQETETSGINPRFRFLVTSRCLWIWRHLGYYCFLSMYCFKTLIGSKAIGSGHGSKIRTLSISDARGAYR